MDYLQPKEEMPRDRRRNRRSISDATVLVIRILVSYNNTLREKPKGNFIQHLNHILAKQKIR